MKMETQLLFFTDGATTAHFQVDGDRSFLPFPINQIMFIRLVMSLILAAILVQGLRKRFIILAYMRSPEIKMNPPNFLYSLDQANGIFLALIIIFRIIFNLLPEPMSDLVDPRICSFAELMSGFYLSGTIVWRCYIAILKLLYIKAQSWLLDRIGVNKLVALTVILGLSKMTLFSLVMINSDKDSYLKRSCYHRNAADLEILYGFEVCLWTLSI